MVSLDGTLLMKAVLKHLLDIFPLKPGKIQLRSAFMTS